MDTQKLPGESSLMTLWIIALSLSLFSFCCAVFSSIPALIISIIALRIANKNVRIYHKNPELYTPSAISNVNLAKTISIITLVLSSLITLFYLLYFFIYGAFIGTLLLGAMESDSLQNDLDTYDDDGTWNQEVIDDWIDQTEEIENDTLLIESIQLDSLN